MRTAVRLLVVCLLSVVLVVAPVTYREAEAQSGWVLYDNFNSLFIDVTKWYGAEEVDFTLPPPRGAAEVFRGLLAGELAIYHRVSGNPVNESINFHNPRLEIRYPESVTAMQAKITVRQYQLQGCPSNTTGSSSIRVRLTGDFFNEGTSTPGSFLNDVAARVEIYRNQSSADPWYLLRVRGRVFRYLDAAGFNQQFAPDVDLGTVNVGQSEVYSVRWDQSTDRFYFRRGSNPEQFTTSPWPAQSASGVPRKALAIISNVANCVSPTTVGSLWATFDNFYVNP